MDINKGDLFIYQSKYGGVVKGVIKGVYTRYAIDYTLNTIYKEFYIISTTGVNYDLCEIKIIAQDLIPDKNARVQFAELVCSKMPKPPFTNG